MSKAFTIGTDPEFFIINENSKKPIKSSTITKGTKDRPLDLGDGFNAHADNVMLELNVPPATTKVGFIKNIVEGKSRLNTLVGPENYIVATPSFEFDKSILTDEIDWEIGCDPDFSAYTKQQNPEIKLKCGKRYAGGHVHVGLPDEDTKDYVVVLGIVKALDYLFLDMIVREDLDQDRKMVYGTPGRFRFKEYGLEYRSLSNFWLSKTYTIGRVYDIVEEAVNNWRKYNTENNKTTIFKNFQTTMKNPATVGTIQNVIEIIK
jgi:hypothetical protein